MKITEKENITEVVAYKVDLLTTDEIRMDLLYDNGSIITISEEDQDWDWNISNLKSLYRFNSEWEKSVVLPPFEMNRTIVYRRMMEK
jgi:hypothetical protein